MFRSRGGSIYGCKVAKGISIFKFHSFSFSLRHFPDWVGHRLFPFANSANDYNPRWRQACISTPSPATKGIVNALQIGSAFEIVAAGVFDIAIDEHANVTDLWLSITCPNRLGLLDGDALRDVPAAEQASIRCEEQNADHVSRCAHDVYQSSSGTPGKYCSIGKRDVIPALSSVVLLGALGFIPGIGSRFPKTFPVT